MELLLEDTDLDTKRKYAVEEEEVVGRVSHSAYIDVKSILAKNDNIEDTEGIAVSAIASTPVAFNLGNDQEVMSYSSVGYYEINRGADNDIVALQKSDTMVNAGAGNDIVKLDGENNILNGNEGNDVIIAQNNGAENTENNEIGNLDTEPLKITAILDGGEGNDTYKISTLEQGEHYIINQSVAGAKDRDSLLLTAFNKTDFDFSKTEKGYLLMTYLPTNATIEIQGWTEHALNRISFKDGRASAEDVEALITIDLGLNLSFAEVDENGTAIYDLKSGNQYSYNLVFDDETSYKDVNYEIDGQNLVITLSEVVTESSNASLADGSGVTLLAAPIEQTVTKTLILKNYLATASEEIVFKDGNTCIYHGKVKRGGNDDTGIGDQVDYTNMSGYLRYFFVDMDWKVDISDYGDNHVIDLSAYKDYEIKFAGDYAWGGNTLKGEIYRADGAKIGTMLLEHAFDRNSATGYSAHPNIIYGNGIKFDSNLYIGSELTSLLVADGVKLVVNGDNYSINGNQGGDIVEVTGDNNTVMGYDGDDRIIITGSGNHVYGNKGHDTYVVDLTTANNNTVTEYMGWSNDGTNKAKLEILNYSHDEILMLYNETEKSMEFIAPNGNSFKADHWDILSNGGYIQFDSITFSDGVFTQEQISDIALNSAKIKNITGSGNFVMESYYTGVAMEGTGWHVTIPTYRTSTTYDLSAYKDYYLKFTSDYKKDGSTVFVDVISGIDNSVIGTLTLENAFDKDDWRTLFLKPNFIYGDNISFNTNASVNVVDGTYYVVATDQPPVITAQSTYIYGHSGKNILELAGEGNTLQTYDANDTIIISGKNNRIFSEDGVDTYIINLQTADNNHIINSGYSKQSNIIIFRGYNSTDVLMCYNENSNVMEFVAENGNFVSFKDYSGFGYPVFNDIRFEDKSFNQEQIIALAGSASKVFNVTGSGNYDVPSFVTSIALNGSNWVVNVTKYRDTLEFDLSGYKDYSIRYTMDDSQDSTDLFMDIFSAEDGTQIGRIVLKNMYDAKDSNSWRSFNPKINYGEGLVYSENFVDIINHRPLDILASKDTKIVFGENGFEVKGHKGTDIIEVAGIKNDVWTFAGDDIITVTGGGNRIVGGTGNDTYVVDLSTAFDNTIDNYGYKGHNKVVLTNLKASEAEFTYNDTLHYLYITAPNGNYVTIADCYVHDNPAEDAYEFTFADKTLTVKQAYDIAMKQLNDMGSSLNITISGYYEVADDVTNIVVDGNRDGRGETIRATIGNINPSKFIDLTAYQDGEFILSFVTDKENNRVELQVQKVHEGEILGTCVALRFAEAAGDSISVGGIRYYDTTNQELKTITQMDFDASGKYMINGTDGVDLLTFGGMANVHAGAGNDIIKAYTSDDKTIFGEAGNDVINVYGGKNVLVDGGVGDDVISVNSDKNTLIVGGAGNDEITVNKAEYAKLSGGAGNDKYTIDFEKTWATIINNNSGSAEADTLELTNVNLDDVTIECFTTTFEGVKDVVCLRINDNTYMDHYVDIMYWDKNPLASIKIGDSVLNTSDIETIIGNDIKPQVINGAREVMKSLMHSLDINTTKIGFEALDEAVVACSSGRYESLEALVTEFKEACMEHGGTTYEEQIAFLKEYCGIDITNGDTGAIIGSDAGGRVDKTIESIVAEPDGMTVNDLVYNYDDFEIVRAPDYYDGESRFGTECYSAQVNNITFYWTEEKWDSLGVDRKNLEQLVSGLINAWTKPSLDLILNSYGIKLDQEGSTLQKLANGEHAYQIEFENDPSSNAIAYVKSEGSYFADNPNVVNKTMEVMVINLGFFQDLLTDINGNPSSSASVYLDRIIAHELTHGVMAANINRFEKLPSFIKEGFAELVHGVDDMRLNEMLQICNTAFAGSREVINDNKEFENAVLNQEQLLNAIFDLENIVGINGTEVYGGGYMLLRYLAKQVADNMTTEELLALNRPEIFDYAISDVSEIPDSDNEPVVHSAADVIKVFMNNLDKTTEKGFAAVNEAVVAASYGRFASLTELVEEFKEVCLNESGSTYEEMCDFLMEYCDIDLDNEDTGSIIGLDAGGETSLNAEDIVKELDGQGISDLVYDRNSYEIVQAPDYYDDPNTLKDFYSAKVNDVTIYWSEDKWDSLPIDRARLETLVSGVINAWGKPAMDLVENATGLNMNSQGSTLNKLADGKPSIQLEFIHDPDSNSLAYVSAKSAYASSAPNITTLTMEVMVINTAYYDDVLDNINGNSSQGQLYLDRVVAHELTHGVMAANINSMAELPTFLTEGLAELVHGIDDSRPGSILELVNNDFSGSKTLTVGDTEITADMDQQELLDAVFSLDNEHTSVGSSTYAGGYLLLRYFGKQVTDYVYSNDVHSFDSDETHSNLAELYKAVNSFADASIGAMEEITFINDAENDKLLKISGNV